MLRQWLKTLDEVKEFFSDFGASFSFDCETTSKDIREFQSKFGYEKKLPDEIANQALNYYYLELEVMSFCDGKKACVIFFDSVDVYKFIELVKPIFLNAKDIIAHNIAFDLKVLRKYNIDIYGKKIHCTFVGDHLLDEEREHALKKLAKSILYKEDTLTYAEARKIGGQVFADYALNDAIWTWELCMWQQPKLKQQNLANVYRNIEMPFQFVLIEMEINGFRVDLERAKSITEVLNKAKESYTIKMLEYLGERFQMQMDFFGGVTIVSPINFESPNQLSAICEKRLQLKKVEETDGGAYSVGKIFLEHYKEHEFVRLLSAYKIVSQLLKLFFEPLPTFVCPDGIVRASFRDTGTKTGRLSCSNPNLQQLAKQTCWGCRNQEFKNSKCTKCGADEPPETRSAFISGEGRTLITADYSGQEVRVMAEISKDKTLVDSLNNGYDMHLAVANQFYGLNIPIEALNEGHPEHNTYKKKFKTERSRAKTITFGLCYGKGAFGFSKDFSISEDEAQKLIDKYFEGMSGLKNAIAESHKEVERFGYVTYLSGRRRHFTKIKNGDWEGYSKKNLRQAFNAKIQGFSADMIRMALNRVLSKSKEFSEYDIKIHATVHDEIIVSCPTQYLDKVKPLIKECMEGAVSFCVPVISDIGQGDNYATAK